MNGGALVNWGLMQVGVFNDLENTEYQEFLSVADELRSEYNFTHTFDTSYVPKTGVDLSAPAVRLYKNFDEGFNDASVSFYCLFQCMKFCPPHS